MCLLRRVFENILSFTPIKLWDTFKMQWPQQVFGCLKSINIIDLHIHYKPSEICLLKSNAKNIKFGLGMWG